MIFYSFINSPYRKILLTSEESYLTGVYFIDQKHYPRIQKNWVMNDDLEIFVDIKTQLKKYFKGTLESFIVDYHDTGLFYRKYFII